MYKHIKPMQSKLHQSNKLNQHFIPTPRPLTDYKCICTEALETFAVAPASKNIALHNATILCILNAYKQYVCSRRTFLSREELRELDRCIQAVQHNFNRSVCVSHLDFEASDVMLCNTSNSRVRLPIVRTPNNAQSVCQAAATMCGQEILKFVMSHSTPNAIKLEKAQPEASEKKIDLKRIAAKNDGGGGDNGNITVINVQPKLVQLMKSAEGDIAKLTAFG
ncbi:Orf54 [Heliothis zea nudivirus]|uniref:Uncharacterized protein n=2 Tax=Betanudivirus hezeae TaxID=3052000 RepID=G9I0A9_HZNV2|nr:Orf54 [Heliothis zea nudivirus]YP_004956831.1 orf83 gene product [Helicoverpa zea nudivirus 2]AAN04348.1 Orf54 [Heliothis zea nudivirus]AEW69632.1 hypothetical protein Hz2V083 [Helicoverpa zea nudivirus 2]WCZ68562.1 hypothetical protein HvNV083 [Heliothis virescens nudivirus]